MKGKSGSGMNKGVGVSDATPSMVYAGEDSNVLKEAKKYKRGGKIGMKHVDAHGSAAKSRLDRPGRKSGGRTTSPFSEAHNVKSPAGRMVESGES
jgi:hypothetical protein